MTDAANPSVRQERDRVSRAIVYGGAAFLISLLIAGWFLTWVIERRTPIHIGFRREDAPAKMVPREVNMIDQTLFSAHLPSRGDWDAKRRALDGYAWVDANRGVARIPIERAMDLIVERGRVE